MTKRVVAVLLSASVFATAVPFTSVMAAEVTDVMEIEAQIDAEYGPPFCEPGSVTLDMLTYQNWHATSFYDVEGGLPVENAVEEITGVKINWECPTADYNTVAQARLAAGIDLPDIIRVPNGAAGLSSLVNDGLVIAMSDYDMPYTEALMERYPAFRAYNTSPDGKIYGLAHAEYNVNNVVYMWNTIRKDWLDKLGLEMPTTIDEYTEVLRAFKTQDPNGNGLQDEIPLIYQNENMYGLYSFKTAFGFDESDTWSDENGQAQFDLMDDKFYDCLKTLHAWYEEGLIQQTSDTSEASAFLSQDLAGGRVLSSSDNLISDAKLIQAVTPEAEFVFIDPLYNENYPDNIEQKISKRNDFNDYYAVTVDCENPEVAVRWLDWCYASQASLTLRYWGFEGETYTVDENGNKNFTEAVTESGDPIGYLRGLGAYVNWAPNDYAEPILDMYEGTYVVEAYEHFKDRVVSRVPLILGTEEENETYTKLWPDIDTYVRENVVNFIVGTRELTDEEWASYKQDLVNMGIEDVVAVRQAWLVRSAEIIGDGSYS